MAPSYQLLNGDTTITLSGGDYHIERGTFRAPPPDRREAWSGQTLFAHGQSLLASQYENRAVVFKLIIKAATQDALIADLTAINSLLERITEFSVSGLGSQGILRRQWTGATNVSNLQVIKGILDLQKTETEIFHAGLILKGVEIRLVCEPFPLGDVLESSNYADDPEFLIAGTPLADWVESKTATGTTAQDTTKGIFGSTSLKLVMTDAGAGAQWVGRYQ